MLEEIQKLNSEIQELQANAQLEIGKKIGRIELLREQMEVGKKEVEINEKTK